MKRHKIFFAVLLIISLFAFTASAQSGFTGMIYAAENDLSGHLTEKAKKKIADDYIEYIGNIGYEPVYIYIEYLGTYDGCELAVIESGSPYGYIGLDIVQTINTAGYDFTFGTAGNEILLHKDGTFIDINTAYDLGYLKYEDIGQAHQIFVEGVEVNNI
ncbi:MAG: hypothetical protein HDT21_01835 [Ruminococcus sp.]|nr:hypothetical protein [Ruminococcus sp.]